MGTSKTATKTTKTVSFYTQKLRLDKVEEPEYMAKVVSNSRDCESVARRFTDQDTIEIFECFSVIFLNKACKPIAWAQLSQGGTSGTVADVKLIFTHALLCGASAIICVHNHPSGCLVPSEADHFITKKIKDSGKMLDIELLDHLILTSKGYYSFADEGMI
jgi:DNA repair protein RadC